MQTAAFIYKNRKSWSFSVGLFQGYSRNFQSTHFFPESFLLARPLQRSYLQGKKFWLLEKEEFKLLYSNKAILVNVFVFFLILTQMETWNITWPSFKAPIWNKAIQSFVSQLRSQLNNKPTPSLPSVWGMSASHFLLMCIFWVSHWDI